MSIAITTENLTKKFRRTSGYADLLPFRKKQWITAVQNVNLDIHEGEFFGLLGPNGAGKTTLVKLLCGLILPTSGSAKLFGHDVVRHEQAVKSLTGMVSSEERSFYWRLTGRENLMFFASLYNISGKPARRRIEEILRVVGMDKDADVRFQNYSTGMRQRLAIARGLLSDPRILFVDEPTRSLDPVNAQAVRSFLKEKVMNEKKTILLATHNLKEAEQLCDRLGIINHGKVIASGTVRELRNLFQTHEECIFQLRNFSKAYMAEIHSISEIIECTLTGSEGPESTLALKVKNRSQVLPFLLKLIMDSGAEVVNCQMKDLPIEEIFTHALKRVEAEDN